MTQSGIIYRYVPGATEMASTTLVARRQEKEPQEVQCPAPTIPDAINLSNSIHQNTHTMDLRRMFTPHSMRGGNDIKNVAATPSRWQSRGNQNRYNRFRRFRQYGQRAGIALIAFALGGMIGPLAPTVRLETAYLYKQVALSMQKGVQPLPPSVPVVFNPLVTPDGGSIDPVNRNFSLIIPKIGVNAAIIPAVNPADSKQYLDVLKYGIAHASTSYFPGEGTTYLFSHSTNYDWFVSDLNAVFYHLKNLTDGDLIVVLYKEKEFTYKLTEKRVVAPSEISYLVGQAGDNRLILQTCWPPGSTTERLLIFADLIEQSEQQI